MVTMRLPATSPTMVMHASAGCPSISTVQAAHWPSPQPYFVPVRSRSSLRTLRRVRPASASIRRRVPLTSSSLMLAMVLLWRTRAAPADCDPSASAKICFGQYVNTFVGVHLLAARTTLGRAQRLPDSCGISIGCPARDQENLAWSTLQARNVAPWPHHPRVRRKSLG